MLTGTKNSFDRKEMLHVAQQLACSMVMWDANIVDYKDMNDFAGVEIFKGYNLGKFLSYMFGFGNLVSFIDIMLHANADGELIYDALNYAAVKAREEALANKDED